MLIWPIQYYSISYCSKSQIFKTNKNCTRIIQLCFYFNIRNKQKIIKVYIPFIGIYNILGKLAIPKQFTNKLVKFIIWRCSNAKKNWMFYCAKEKLPQNKKKHPNKKIPFKNNFTQVPKQNKSDHANRINIDLYYSTSHLFFLA